MLAEPVMSTNLCYIVWRIPLEVNRPSDLQVGLSIQVGGFDEANLHHFCVIEATVKDT